MTDKVESWIESKRIAPLKEFRSEVRTFLDNVRRYNRLSCTYCRTESNTSICAGCYNERVATWLASKDQKFAKEYLNTFKYSINKKQLIA